MRFNLVDCSIQILNNHVVVVTCSVKFMNKIQYVYSLDELAEIIPMEHVQVPECVVQ